MAFQWRYEDSSGGAVDAPELAAAEAFPSQADAETWMGENWRELLHAGVAQVVLLEDDREVYGPMGLDAGL
jgi:hypothetical protein